MAPLAGTGTKDNHIIDEKKMDPGTMKVWHSTASAAWPTDPPAFHPQLLICSHYHDLHVQCRPPPPHDLLSISPALGLTHLLYNLHPTLPKSLDWCPRCFPSSPHCVAVVHSFIHSFIDVCSNSDSTQSNNPGTMCLLKLHSPGHTAESISMLSVFSKKKELHFERMDF